MHVEVLHSVGLRHAAFHVHVVLSGSLAEGDAEQPLSVLRAAPIELLPVVGGKFSEPPEVCLADPFV